MAGLKGYKGVVQWLMDNSGWKTLIWMLEMCLEWLHFYCTGFYGQNYIVQIFNFLEIRIQWKLITISCKKIISNLISIDYIIYFWLSQILNQRVPHVLVLRSMLRLPPDFLCALFALILFPEQKESLLGQLRNHFAWSHG